MPLYSAQDESRIKKILSSPYTPYALAALSGIIQSLENFKEFKTFHDQEARRLTHLAFKNDRFCSYITRLPFCVYEGDDATRPHVLISNKYMVMLGAAPFSDAGSGLISFAPPLMQYFQRRNIDCRDRTTSFTYLGPVAVKILSNLIADFCLSEQRPRDDFIVSLLASCAHVGPIFSMAVLMSGWETYIGNLYLADENEKLKELLKKNQQMAYNEPQVSDDNKKEGEKLCKLISK